MDVFALDFDGVICDSAAETGVTGWRAGRAFIPEWDALEPPPGHLDRFVRLRPFLETGYQAILLMRMIDRGVSSERISSAFADHCEEMLAELGQTREVLVQAFGTTRDEWIAGDLEDWLSRHRFYPGVIDRLTRAMASSPAYILTTKQQRFAAALLHSQNLGFAPEHIFGLDTGRPKEDILGQLQQEHGPRARIHFVEDRLPTLDRIAARADLYEVRLYLADWGYVTSEALRAASANPRITTWNLGAFLSV